MRLLKLRPFAVLLLAGLAFTALPVAARPSIFVEGNSAFSDRRVSLLTALPDPTPEWSRQEWADWAYDAAILVREAYRERGYLETEARVEPVFTDSSAFAAPVEVVVHVDEGARYSFGEVRIGLPGPGYPAYHGALVSRSGRPFQRSLLFEDRREILRFYGDEGFLRAQAAESLYYDIDRKAVNVAFRVQPGAALVFDTLVFDIRREGDTTARTGLTKLSELQDLFPFERGDTLSLTELNNYERKLKSTRVFNFVRLRDSTPAGETGGIIRLSAEERIPGEIEAAGYWETQYGFGTDLAWTHANLRGRMQEGRLGFTFAQRKQSVLAGYTAPLLFGTSVRFDNELVANWYQDNYLVRDSGWYDGDFDVSNTSKLSRQFLPWLRGVSGAELFGKSQRIDTNDRVRDFNLNFLNTIYLQRLDNWVNPSRGARLGVTWGNGGSLLDGQHIAVHRNRHNWLEAEAATYVPVGNRVTVALRLDGGRFFGEGGINSPRFYLGGARSVRSRDWRSVCPVVTADGNCEQEGIEPAYVLGSAELRLQPFFGATSGVPGHLAGVQIVPFADYGNVWNVGSPLAPSGEGRAVGLGVRYAFLSLFNIRVDYARDPRDASVSRWMFDLAQAF
ncbi:MAG TPA: BamA/TamA family outer membrane protein [Fibrobacteria bacterium]|nr:BamA/TamA family outer membrane protein [Fibrobacteria bacterium]